MQQQTKNTTIEYTGLFIDNEFRSSFTGRKFATYSPFDRRQLALIDEAENDDVEYAVKCAREAAQKTGGWKDSSPSRRARSLRKLADMIEQNVEKLANLDSLENGIPIVEMRHCAQASAEIFRFYAGLATSIRGDTIPMDEDGLVCLTIKAPLGVVGIIIPWNSPTLMLAKTMAPALACGNTVLIKPAEQTSLSALLIASFVVECDFPPGVINVLPGGPQTGRLMAEHLDIDAITFTGSCEVGKKILAASAASNLKRVTLELGGKNPLVVFDDVNLDQAAQLAFQSLFVSNGQVCCSASRVYVQTSVYEDFIGKIRRLVQQRILGDPCENRTDQGPQIESDAVERILNFIESASKQGARLVIGGKRVGDTLFIEPTVFADVTESMTVGREEIFGPVMQIFKFDTLDEVVRRANDTRFGLAAGILTSNIDRALHFARNVRAGTCWINCYFVVRPQTPFGGFQQSGWGREFGDAAMDRYLELKTITINSRRNEEEGFMFG